MSIFPQFPKNFLHSLHIATPCIHYAISLHKKIINNIQRGLPGENSMLLMRMIFRLLPIIRFTVLGNLLSSPSSKYVFAFVCLAYVL